MRAGGDPSTRSSVFLPKLAWGSVARTYESPKATKVFETGFGGSAFPFPPPPHPAASSPTAAARATMELRPVSGAMSGPSVAAGLSSRRRRPYADEDDRALKA